MRISLFIGSIATTAVLAGSVVGLQYALTKHQASTPKLGTVGSQASVEKPLVEHPRLSGTYRCRSFNVGGSGRSCTSPPIVFNTNGSYTMSSERGTYTVNGNTVALSESKIRGPGTLLEEKQQIRFEYTYDGLKQTITYFKQEMKTAKPSTSSAGPVYLDLTIKYSTRYSAIDSISTIELKSQGGGITYEALAYATDGQTLKAYYKPSRGGVPGGEIYNVFAGGVNVGVVDLRKTIGEVSRTLQTSTP